jgi:iron complex transport system substrate-binding protein
MRRLLVTTVALLAICVMGTVPILGGARLQARVPRRIISLVPALTEMLFAMGAGPQVVGVSSYDSFPPEAASRPQVGALLDPDVERIFSLTPDLVITYGSQSDLRQQLERASIPVFDYRHAGLADVLTTLRALGRATGHDAEAGRLASAIERRLDAVKARTAAAPAPRTLLVFGREPGSLRNMYVSGGTGLVVPGPRVASAVERLAGVLHPARQAP